jgi:dihydropteroate synthase
MLLQNVLNLELVLIDIGGESTRPGSKEDKCIKIEWSRINKIP